MVCKKCEKKLSKVAAPDPTQISSSSNRKIGENKLLTSKRFSPYSSKCRDCKGSVTQTGAVLCSSCSYKSGKCALCGAMVLDVRKGQYKQSVK